MLEKMENGDSCSGTLTKCLEIDYIMDELKRLPYWDDVKEYSFYRRENNGATRYEVRLTIEIVPVSFWLTKI